MFLILFVCTSVGMAIFDVCLLYVLIAAALWSLLQKRWHDSGNLTQVVFEIFVHSYRGFVLCMETNMIITLLCAANKWNHVQLRSLDNRNYRKCFHDITSIEKEYAKTQTLCHLASLKLHWKRSWLIRDWCDTQTDSSVTWYKRKISKRERNPFKWLYCLLRFK